jgi:uncharacterized protein DUF998
VTVAAAAASLVLTAGCVGCLLYLHLFPTAGYSPIRETVSEYGITPHAAWYRAQVRLAAGAAVLLAAAVRHPARVVVLLLVFAAARMAISFFPILSREHLLLAAVAFVAVAWAATALKGWEDGVPTLGWVMSLCLLALVLARRAGLRQWRGLIERGFYAAALAWLVVVAVNLL